ncbi:hypothetical protein IKP85_06650 [bacterium]|nr:hypothetical protein [bacterium]
MVTKKTTKKITVNKVKKDAEFVETTKPISDEEKIFGSSVEIVKERVINYESPKVLYKVYNLKLNNAPMTITGDLVETFIGNNNLKAREDLKKGVKTVISKDTNGTELYKIEVL